MTSDDLMTIEPTDADMLDGHAIRLSRTPASESARALTDAVVALMVTQAAPGARKAGPGKVRSMAAEAGVILGALLQGSASGHVLSAQRGHSAAMWRNAAINPKAFWARLGEMKGAGLVGERLGVKGPPIFGNGTGLPTRLWATTRLTDLAGKHDIALDDLERHWQLSLSAQAPVIVATADLVRVRPVPGWATQAPSAAVLAPLQERIRRLNAHVATAAISGCAFPAFERVFHGDTRIYGRITALGPETFQNITKASRADITINGEHTVEVDAKASQLTIFVAMTGRTVSLPHDPYDLPGLQRAAVKAFCVQTFGTGRVPGRWSDTAKPEVRAVKLREVRDAVLAAYPALADPTTILPPDLQASPPPQGIGWASGQFLVWRESEALSAALEDLETKGVVALPLHDGLIVPKSAAAVARQALADAYASALGVVARIDVKPS